MTFESLNTAEAALSAIVLVVTDNPESREAYQTALSADGAWVTASGEADAVEYAVDLQPDVILADTQARVGDSASLARRLQANIRLQDVPIVLVTASPPRPPLNGVSAVLRQPARMADVLTQVRRI